MKFKYKQHFGVKCGLTQHRSLCTFCFQNILCVLLIARLCFRSRFEAMLMNGLAEII
jgi:hypothetical protein